MEVENYTQNFDDWNSFANDGRGRFGIKRTRATINKRAYARLVREARTYVDGYGIDFSQFEEPEVIFHDMLTAQVDWKHKVTGNKISLTQIWFDKKTGSILQCGTQCGVFTL